MATWWVNHKQSYRAERDGGFIWSPKTPKSGAFSQFYKNMTLVAPGDAIISYAKSKVSDVGVAVSSAVSTAIPEAHQKRKDNDWDRGDGWTVSISWMKLSQSIKPKQLLSALIPFLPEKYAPLQLANGNGNNGAYLSAVEQGALDVMLSASGPNERVRFDQHLKTIVIGDPEQTVDDTIQNTILGEPGLDQTTRENIVKSRLGQGQFKTNLRQIEAACRLTGVGEPSLLVASHIQPWRSCLNSYQRLDGNNGLLLTPNADRLFDRGYISFDDDGTTFVKDEITDQDLERLGLAGLRGRNIGRFSAEQQVYLKFHRELHGFAES